MVNFPILAMILTAVVSILFMVLTNKDTNKNEE